MPFEKRPEIIEKITCHTKNQKQKDYSKMPLTMVTTFDPWLRKFPEIIRKHWKKVEDDPFLKNIFPNPLIFAYKKDKTIASKIVKSKISNQPEPPMEKDTLPIKTIHPSFNRKISRCRSANCKLCRCITTSNTITSSHTKRSYPIKQEMNCRTWNVIYVITCKHCNQQYVGQTSQSLQDRITKHRNDLKSKNYLIYQHFRRHRLNMEDDIKVTPIEQVTKEKLLETETKWIKTLETLNPKGLNSKFEKHSDTNEIVQAKPIATIKQ